MDVLPGSPGTNTHGRGCHARDKRPPFLYLRSFDQEGNTFAYVSRADAEKYCEVTSYSRAVAFNLTLEQFLAREIDHKIPP